ncbi:hypothetical protein CS022_08685 [Veronia nyctiphanis]|uniref:Lipoprotein n=1 Tax=Veronia nyctiphanis TaxID=1278244 RepID=A0A4Q0YWZ3_9GAMM|nr:hypothetical protein [Veronia nyctiphanis]RXJ73571.1 hypothetical protein CS022_08685 [Veronia nyctiphanis]
MKKTLLVMLTLLVSACSTQYPNQSVEGKVFPSITGQTLEEQPVNMPGHFSGNLTVLLVGYVQDTQFDIDRWLIGLDMTKTEVAVYELPAIQGMFPRMFSTFIDNGMRSGIPKPLWKGVVTIYKDGDKVQAFTGNDRPRNARVLLLDKEGKIIYFYDDGFSVTALNALRAQIDSNR